MSLYTRHQSVRAENEAAFPFVNSLGQYPWVYNLLINVPQLQNYN